MINQKILRSVGLLGVLAFLSFETQTDRFEIVKNLDIFSDVFKEVNNLYIEEVQPGELIKTGIDEMLSSLDPYTVYYPESEIEDFEMMKTGQYGGIGARIKRINEELVVQEVFKNSPSMKAGLKVGDIIIMVDDHIIQEHSSYELSKLLKGTPGTELIVKVVRTGIKEAITLQFKREKITISSVPYYGMLDKEVGYIKLSSFTRKVSSEIKTAFLELKKQGMNRLVFDLRGNPGGLLVESVNIVNLFTPKSQLVVETRGKVASWNKQYKNLHKATDLEIPLVVLVDGGSASASEIVSGSLQDLDRAVIIGENTYGKGLVQTTMNLKYKSSLKVTTAKYFIPSGRCIQEINYSKKNKSGKAEKIPDSLRTYFKTKNGRQVEDGHGIQPDVKLEIVENNYLLRALSRANLFFSFIQQEYGTIDSVAIPAKFEVSDEVFERFVQHCLASDLNVKSNTEKKLDKALEVANREELELYVKEGINEVLNKIQANKTTLIRKQKEKIKGILKAKILTKYYHREGRIEGALKDDKWIKEAIKIIKNNDEYQSFLSN